MNINKLWFYTAGLLMGGAVAVIIATWGEAAMVYRVSYVGLLGLLLFATWFKPKPHKTNGKADNNSPYAMAYKSSDKSTDETTKG
jgi:hypothetical protein